MWNSWKLICLYFFFFFLLKIKAKGLGHNSMYFKEEEKTFEM